MGWGILNKCRKTSDADGDGIPGIGAPEVFPVVGLVVGVNYNKTPDFDSDENSVFDFQEFGGPITSISHPLNVVSSQGKKDVFEASATASSPLAFQWQLSTHAGNNWVDV